MTAMFFTDAYASKPMTRRAELEQELRRLKMMHWADGASDDDLKQRIAELEDEIAALDHQQRSAS